MEFEFLTFQKEGLVEAIHKIDTKFRANLTAQQVVKRKFLVEPLRDGYKVKVSFDTIFPSFKVPAMYVGLIGVIFSIIFKNSFFLFSGLIGSCFLLIPDVVIRPKFLFAVLKQSLKRNGYKGNFFYVGGTK